MVAKKDNITGHVLDHLCRVCESGRLFQIVKDGKPETIFCTNCGAEVSGGKPEVLCWCGHQYEGGKRSRFYKCVKNENKTSENPHAVMIELSKEVR